MTAEASPEVDFSTVTIVKASREQAIQSGINVIPLWCAPKGVTSSESLAWLDEQLHSPAHPWTAEQQSWVLVPRDDPTTTDILAHCDTYRRAGVVRLPDGRQRDVVTYNVGLVFTPPQRRKKGYAKHMMRLMHYVVAPLGVLPPFPQEWGRLPEERFGDATFSTLYSDVGDAFYARCTKGLTAPGWVASTDRAPHRVWNLDITDTDRQYPPDCVWLDDTGAIPLEKQMAAWMRSEAQSVGDAQRIRVFCSPENGWLRYSWLRERLFTLAADIVVDHRIIGVQLPDSTGGGDPPFFTFTVIDTEGKPRRLTVDFMYKPEQIPFSAVRSAAARVDATQVEMWGGYSGWDSEGPEQPTLQSQELVPCLAQYGLTDNDDEIQWLWCQHNLVNGS